MTRTETAFAAYLRTSRALTQAEVDARTADRDTAAGPYVAHAAHTAHGSSRH
jgi:hypothetical protein